MKELTRLFGRSIRFTYHCFDRIVIRGYLSTLSRPENIVYFFRTIKQVDCISKETLRQPAAKNRRRCQVSGVRFQGYGSFAGETGPALPTQESAHGRYPP